MRIPMVTAALVALALLASPRAEAAPPNPTWCANDGEFRTCGFISFQQCLVHAAGHAAYCDVDIDARNPQTTSPRARRQ
jgi:hypothetical protein